MNDLDRQLAELALINKAELQPTSGNTLNKKIGPAVPPKPKKNQPQVNYNIFSIYCILFLIYPYFQIVFKLSVFPTFLTPPIYYLTS